MLKVAFISDAPRVAGSEIWLRDLLPLLLQHNILPTVFLPNHATLKSIVDDLTAAGVEVKSSEQLANLSDQATDFDLRVIQAWEPATYHQLLRQFPKPTWVISHDQLDYHYPRVIQMLYRKIYQYTKAAALQKASGVITVSHWGAQFLRQTMRLPHTLEMTNGTDTQRFYPASEAEQQALKQAFGFQRFTVLVPGRFTLEKNQLLAYLSARHAPDLDFVFVGDMDSGLGKLTQILQKLRHLPNVYFLGRRQDMSELYRASDVLLQPTLAENQSLVTLEAMSSGLPVVTTHIPAQAELVRDGQDGLLVSVQPQLLARALKALAHHPQRAKQMGQSARQRVLERHTLKQSADQLAQLLKQAAHPHHS